MFLAREASKICSRPCAFAIQRLLAHLPNGARPDFGEKRRIFGSIYVHAYSFIHGTYRTSRSIPAFSTSNRWSANERVQRSWRRSEEQHHESSGRHWDCVSIGCCDAEKCPRYYASRSQQSITGHGCLLTKLQQRIVLASRRRRLSG